MTSDDVHDAASFAQFVSDLQRSLNDPEQTGAWENPDLPRFLDAMSAWAAAWPKPAHRNPWRHAADVLSAAKIYE